MINLYTMNFTQQFHILTFLFVGLDISIMLLNAVYLKLFHHLFWIKHHWITTQKSGDLSQYLCLSCVLFREGNVFEDEEDEDRMYLSEWVIVI